MAKSQKYSDNSNFSIPLSCFVTRLPDYVADANERTLFDWLIFQQHYLGKDIFSFNFPVRRIVEATGVKKAKVRALLKKFAEEGWLLVEICTYKKNKYTNIFVDYKKLVQVLEKHIKLGTPTYSDLGSWLVENKQVQAIKDEIVEEIVKEFREIFDSRLDFWNEHHHQKSWNKDLTLTLEGEMRIKRYIRDSKAMGVKDYYVKLTEGFKAFCDAYFSCKLDTNDPISTFLYKSPDGEYVHVNGNYSVVVCNPEYFL